jgi:hypothetical protein
MNASQVRMNGHSSQRFNLVRWILFSCFTLFVLVPCPAARAQNAAPQNAAQQSAAAASCPVEFVHFDPSGVSVRVRNVSGKKIVGLTFNAALADATEHWKWYHWNFDDSRPIREFGWNKLIKENSAKTLSWYREDIDFEHGGGGAFVLTSALFDDGSIWEAPASSASCKYVWYNNHKKSFVRPVELPFRQ